MPQIFVWGYGKEGGPERAKKAVEAVSGQERKKDEEEKRRCYRPSPSKQSFSSSACSLPQRPRNTQRGDELPKKKLLGCWLGRDGFCAPASQDKKLREGTLNRPSMEAARPRPDRQRGMMAPSFSFRVVVVAAIKREKDQSSFPPSLTPRMVGPFFRFFCQSSRHHSSCSLPPSEPIAMVSIGQFTGGAI